MKVRHRESSRVSGNGRPSTAPANFSSSPQRPRRRRILWIGAGAAAVAVTGGLLWATPDGDGNAGATEQSAPASTVEVTRASIAATQEFAGTLGHGSAATISAGTEGVITGLAPQDSPVERGSELYRIGEHPVVVLLGEIPMYRDLAAGDVGVDVAQLEANLAELGYDGFTVDDTYTSATAAAVEAWQADLGIVEPSGAVRNSDVVFLPDPGRVDALHARVGDRVSPGTAVLDVTGSDQVVSLEVDVRDRELLTVGTEVTVQLPGGDEIAGTVTAANAVEAASDSDAPGSDDTPGADDTVITVQVTMGAVADEMFLGSPVDVVVEIDERADVLTVPVNALLALAEGGHGIEVVAHDGTTSIVPVETGLFANGSVEISGDDIDEGTIVVTAAR